jgi:hypothetical protein
MAALHYATYFDVAPVLTKLLHKTKANFRFSIRATIKEISFDLLNKIHWIAVKKLFKFHVFEHYVGSLEKVQCIR